jgi:hypothetical protein
MSHHRKEHYFKMVKDSLSVERSLYWALTMMSTASAVEPLARKPGDRFRNSLCGELRWRRQRVLTSNRVEMIAARGKVCLHLCIYEIQLHINIQQHDARTTRNRNGKRLQFDLER